MRRQASAGIPGRGRAIKGVLLVSLALALAACTPTASIDRTVAYDGTPVRGEPGVALRIVVPFGYGDFRLEPGDLDPLPFPEIVFQPRENVTGSFVMRAVDAPEGWAVALDRVERVVHRIEAEDGHSDGGRGVPEAGRTYALDVALRVDVPPDADPGTYAVLATIRARNTAENTVRLVVAIPRRSEPRP